MPILIFNVKTIKCHQKITILDISPLETSPYAPIYPHVLRVTFDTLEKINDRQYHY